MSPHRRLIRIPTLAVLACLALAGLVVADSGSAATPIQRATRSCTPPKYPGAGYFTGKIRVTGVTCTYGKSFVLAYYKCRTSSGRHPGGHCHTRVRRFRCTEVRQSIPTEIDARVTCRRGSQRIIHTYQQNIE
jgi:hypothetical protein